MREEKHMKHTLALMHDFIEGDKSRIRYFLEYMTQDDSVDPTLPLVNLLNVKSTFVQFMSALILGQLVTQIPKHTLGNQVIPGVTKNLNIEQLIYTTTVGNLSKSSTAHYFPHKYNNIPQVASQCCPTIKCQTRTRIYSSNG